MAGKKTGLYLNPIAEEIVNKIRQKYGYTKISNCINFIVLEYDKLVNQKQEVVENKIEKKIQTNLNDWFVVEGK